LSFDVFQSQSPWIDSRRYGTDIIIVIIIIIIISAALHDVVVVVVPVSVDARQLVQI